MATFAADVLDIVPSSRCVTPVDQVAAAFAGSKGSIGQIVSSVLPSDSDASVGDIIVEIVNGLAAACGAEVDPKVIAVIVVCLSGFQPAPVPNPAKQFADASFPGTAPARALGGGDAASSAETATEAARALERQRRGFLDSLAPQLAAASAAHFGAAGTSTLHKLASHFTDQVAHVARKTKQGSVAGGAVVSVSAGGAVVVEHCTDSTVFVTASVSRLVVRDCVRCSIVAVPSLASVTVLDCRGCSITAAAPLVHVRNAKDTTAHVAASAPVVVSGDSVGVQIGFYNAVVPNLLTRFPLLASTAASLRQTDDSAATSAADADSSAELPAPTALVTSPTRDAVSQMTKDKLGWVFLPLSENVAATADAAASSDDRLPLPVPTLSPAAAARAWTAELSGAAALRAEATMQSAFTVSALSTLCAYPIALQCY
jgi:hypothetical protein